MHYRRCRPLENEEKTLLKEDAGAAADDVFSFKVSDMGHYSDRNNA